MLHAASYYGFKSISRVQFSRVERNRENIEIEAPRKQSAIPYVSAGGQVGVMCYPAGGQRSLIIMCSSETISSTLILYCKMNRHMSNYGMQHRSLGATRL